MKHFETYEMEKMALSYERTSNIKYYKLIFIFILLDIIGHSQIIIFPRFPLI